MARYLYGMLQDCTVCSVPVVNKEQFYIKKKVGTGNSFPGVKQSVRESDHPHLSSAEIKNMWSHTSNSAICRHGTYRDK